MLVHILLILNCGQDVPTDGPDDRVDGEGGHDVDGLLATTLELRQFLGLSVDLRSLLLDHGLEESEVRLQPVVLDHQRELVIQQQGFTLLEVPDRVEVVTVGLVHLRKLLHVLDPDLGVGVLLVHLLQAHLGDGGQQAPVTHVLHVHEVLGDREHGDDHAHEREEVLEEHRGGAEGVDDGVDGVDVEVRHCIAFSLS